MTAGRHRVDKEKPGTSQAIEFIHILFPAFFHLLLPESLLVPPPDQSVWHCRYRIPQFTEEELLRELAEPLSYYAERDRSIIAERVCQTILIRQKENLCHLYAV